MEDISRRQLWRRLLIATVLLIVLLVLLLVFAFLYPFHGASGQIR